MGLILGGGGTGREERLNRFAVPLQMCAYEEAAMAYCADREEGGRLGIDAGFGVALVAGFALGRANMVHVADSDSPANLVVLRRALGGGTSGSVWRDSRRGGWLARCSRCPRCLR